MELTGSLENQRNGLRFDDNLRRKTIQSTLNCYSKTRLFIYFVYAKEADTINNEVSTKPYQLANFSFSTYFDWVLVNETNRLDQKLANVKSDL